MNKNVSFKAFSAILITLLVITVLPVKPARADTTAELPPTGNGNYTFWANDWNEIEEGTLTADCTGVGSGDGITSNTNNQRESVTVSLASIPNGSTITSIVVIARDRANAGAAAGGTYATFIRFNGTDSGNSATHAAADPGPGFSCSNTRNDTFDVTDTVKNGATTLEIGVIKINSGGITNNSVRVGAMGVVVTFTPPPSHTITASAGAGGTITPSGAVSVFEGSNQSFDITPNPSFIVSGVSVDAAPVAGRPNAYTFTNVTSDHTIAASFDGGWSQPAADADNGWTNEGNAYISDNAYGVSNANGEDAEFFNFGLTIPPSATINGIEVAVEGNATGSREVAIDLSSGAGFTTGDPSSTFTNGGADATLLFGGSSSLWGRAWTPADISNLRVRLVSNNGTGDVNIDQVQVKVHFTATSHTITASAGAGGTITPSGAVNVFEGLNQSFDVTPNTSYIVSSVSVDAAPVAGRPNAYTFTNVTSDHTIAASFDGGWSQPAADADNGWTNEANAYVSDNAYGVSNNNNEDAEFFNFGISIPGGSTINGIEVAVEGNATGSREVAIDLSSGAGFTTGDPSTTFTNGGADATLLFGGSSSLWGRAWTPADISNLRVRLVSNNGTGDVNIDQVQVKVYYTLPNTAPTGGNGSVTTNEDTLYTFTVADFTTSTTPQYNDAESNPFSGVRITSLETVGDLECGGVDVPLNGTCANVTTLTFIPATDANGAGYATFNFEVYDGALYSATSYTMTLNVTAINDEPDFTANNPSAVNEDAGAQTVAGWVTSVDLGAANESGQSVSQYIVSNSTCGTLLSAGPAVDTAGTLTYTPAADESGTCTFDIQVQDNGSTANAGDDTSPIHNFAITVNAINEEPDFTASNPAAIDEDAGAQTVAGWVASVDFGPANEDSSQAVSAYVVSNSTCGALLSAGPSINNAGTLSYTPAADANGTCTFDAQVQDNGGVANGGDDLGPVHNFTITVNAINDEPDFTAANPAAVNENSGIVTVTGWVTAVDFGAANESGQNVLQYIVSNSTCGTLLSTGPVINASGDLSYTPITDESGTCTFDAQVQDDGGTANGGDDTSPVHNFTITVSSSNNEPDFTATDPSAVTEDSPAQTVVGWVTSVDFGAANEAGQNVLQYIVSNSTCGTVLTAGPAIDTTGTLTYTPAADAFGTCTFDAQVQDDGGTANGGDDTGPAHNFTITVGGINEEPDFTAINPAAVNEDAGAQTVVGWVTSVDFGPANEDATQAVSAYLITNSTCGTLLSAGPSVTNAGDLSFTPAANENGSCTFDAQVQDNGGTASGGDDTGPVHNFTITVNVVNDMPGFTAVNPPSVALNAGAQTVNSWAAFNPGLNEATQNVSQYIITNSTCATLLSAGPAVDTAGNLTYTPAVNQSGTCTFDAQVQDDGGTANGGVDTSSPAQSFTITVNVSPQTITITLNAPASASNGSSFDVAATASSGLPVTITTSGSCSGGDTDGTATITMTSSTGICSVVYSQAGDSNYLPAPTIQEDVTATEGPVITSANNTSYDLGFPGIFSVTATGNPSTMTITVTGTLPTGIIFTDNGNGTAAFSGTPTTAGVFNLIITANNGVAPNAVQNFTLTVRGGPVPNNINSSPDTGDANVIENEIIPNTLGITQLFVTFSQNVYNPAGDSDADDVTNPANFVLVRSATGTFQTVSCAGGAVSPDVAIKVNSVTYNDGGGAGPFVATLNINDGLPLNVDGFYRLFVCGTTSIVDATNTALALAGNGTTPGTDFLRNFRIVTAGTGGGGGDDDDDSNDGGGSGNNSSGTNASISTFSGLQIPVTGFTPNKITRLPAQPADKSYASSGLVIEIPSLSVKIPIVGVQLKDNGWDVTWLGNNAGFLEGSAYPTWKGNTVITGHVTDANGKPGIFAFINELKDGDKVYIHNDGFIYVYEVRGSKSLFSSSIRTLFKHEDDSWLSLVTCENYNAKTGKFTHRRLVRAVLISIIPEK